MIIKIFIRFPFYEGQWELICSTENFILENNNINNNNNDNIIRADIKNNNKTKLV